MHPRSVPPRWRALAAALVLGTAACADQPTAPAPARTAPGATSASTAATLTRPALISNKTRYRWNGARPVTGRSGSAVLTARALQGRDGKTELELVSSSSLDPWWYGSLPRGMISNLQVKVFDPRGRLVTTRNHPNLDAPPVTTLTLDGIPPRSTLQVQAAVRELDGERTHIVTVTDTVRRRSNLAVAELGVPARIRAGTMANITATVRETNGDVGAYAQCLLYVDGHLTDWAYWMWVDAGDAVTCAFTRRFDRDAVHDVEVRLEEMSPRDDDPSDDRASAPMEVTWDGNLLYAAVIGGQVYDSYSLWSGHWASGGSYREEWHHEESRSSRTQSSRFYAWIPRPTTAPRLELDEITGGRTIFSVAMDMGPLAMDDGCAFGMDESAGVRVYLCGFGSESTMSSFSYERYAGSATYHSQGYSSTWYGGTDEYVYTYNDQGANTYGTFLELGPDFAYDVRLIDGERVYAARPVFPIVVDDSRFHQPYGCSSYADVFSDYAFCSAGESTNRYYRGTAENIEGHYWY
ncbi:MAG TPA: hypothetical protein VHG91_18160 [Longimicrobium sp.]|nr:hypothetical protein [Longimicrobium sp.]